MREWGRAVRRMRCGGCGNTLDLAAPVLAVRVNGRLVKYRGECCAGPAPPELAPFVQRAPIEPRPFVPVRFMAGMLPLDWRRRSSGERDPGEEG